MVSGLGLCAPDLLRSVCKPKSERTASSLPFEFPEVMQSWYHFCACRDIAANQMCEVTMSTITHVAECSLA